MRKNIIKFVSVISMVALFVTSAVSVNVNAAQSASEIQSEINDLEQESKKLEAQIKSLQGQINEQTKLKKAIEDKMAVVQKQINACNSQINAINAQISANKAEIEKNNQQIEKDKLVFKKRLRAIYMSNTGSNAQILLGAEDFSQFLQLAQLTASVSAHDKKMIEELVAEIKKLEAKQQQNQQLLKDQEAIKATIAQKQQELAKEEKQIQSVINSIAADQKEAKEDNARVEKELRDMQNALNAILNDAGNAGGKVVYSGDAFLWPTPTISRISSPFGPRWGRYHNGIDISNGTYGAKVVAIADGVVTTYSNNCKHNYGKKPLYNCCGNGYGNYITINHGTKDGNTYVAYYAHLGSITVSPGQTVKKGQIVGYVGSTGRSTGAHLHFGIAVNGAWKNPMSFYKKVG